MERNVTPEIEQGLARLRAEFGREALARVDAMLAAKPQERHPLQRQARWVMPGLTSKPWHDPYEYEPLQPIVRGLERLHPCIKQEVLTAMGVAHPLEAYSDRKSVV